MKDNLPSSISTKNESHNSTMLSLVEERFKTMPDHRIFQWVDEKGREAKNLTYEQLWNQSGLVANALRNNPDITKGDRVMICYPFGLEFLAGLFGCMKAGVIPCSAYPPNPRKLSTDFPIFLRKAEDAGAKFVLTTAHFRRVMITQQVLGHIPKKINWIVTNKLKHARHNNTPSVNDDFVPSLDDIAFIQYSSGSTGFPKGVMISHRSLITNCQELTKVCLGTDDVDKTKGTVFVAWTPQYHDLGLIGQFMHSIYAAYSAVTFSPLDFIQNPLLWHELIVKYKSVITQGPNFSFGLVSKRLSQKIASLEEIAKRKQKQNGRSSTSTLGIYHQKWGTIGCVCIAAEPVDPKVVGQMQSILGIPRKSIQVGYGMAETGVYISNGSGNVHDGTPACGRIDGDAATIRVVNNEGCEITQDGVVGEIWVHAPSLVALGYWGQPELSEKTFKNKLEGHDGLWLATGDLGKVVDGEFHVTGRIKDLIIINGRNFYSVDLERTLEEKYPKVLRPGCIVAFQGAPAGVGIVGEVRKGTRKEDIPDPAEVRKEVTNVHGVSVVYVRLLKAHTVPKTTSGKLKRLATKEKSLARAWKKESILAEFDAPQGNPSEICKDLTEAHGMVAADETNGEPVLLRADALTPKSKKRMQAPATIGEVHGGLASEQGNHYRVKKEDVPWDVPSDTLPPVAFEAVASIRANEDKLDACFKALRLNHHPILIEEWKELDKSTKALQNMSAEALELVESNQPTMVQFVYLLASNVDKYIIKERSMGLLDDIVHRAFVLDWATKILLEDSALLRAKLDDDMIAEDEATRDLEAVLLPPEARFLVDGEMRDKLFGRIDLFAWLKNRIMRSTVEAMHGRSKTKYLEGDDERMNALTLDILEATWVDYLNGRTENVSAGAWLAARSRTHTIRITPENQIKYDLEHDLFAEAYKAWDLAFVLSSLNSPWMIATLLMPECSLKPSQEDYFGKRALSLHMVVQMGARDILNGVETSSVFTKKSVLTLGCLNKRWLYSMGVDLARDWPDPATTKPPASSDIPRLFEKFDLIMKAKRIPGAVSGSDKSFVQKATKTMRRRSSLVDATTENESQSSARTILQIVSDVVGREASMDETMADLGLSSMELSILHSKIQMALNMDEEPFPVAKLFDADLTVDGLTKLVRGEHDERFSPKQSVAAQLEEICETLMVEAVELTNSDVVSTTTLGSLGLTVEQKSEYHAAMCVVLDLENDKLPLSWFSEVDLTFEDLALRIMFLTNATSTFSPNQKPASKHHPEPLKVPVLVEITRFLVQLVAIITPAVFVGVALLPGLVFARTVNPGYDPKGLLTLGLLSPVFALIFTLSATILLIVSKWMLVGTQKPVHQAVWGGSFARRWVVRQCCRFCWTYTSWAWLAETDLLCWVHRLLGSKIGKEVTFSPGAIEDFDLVSIGDGSSFSGTAVDSTCTLSTEVISMGVQTLKPVSVGRRCTISERSMVDQGSVLEDDVFLEKLTMVSRNSVLEEGSRWHGTPAKPVMRPNNTHDSAIPADVRERSRFQLFQYFLAFVVSPYLLTIEAGIVFGMGYIIWKHLGLWGLAALVWVPISTSMFFASLMCIACKWMLLGRVQPGSSWPVHGSFHMRKKVVDHVFSHHLLLLRHFATLVGSPIANSPRLLQGMLRCLGAKIGTATIPREWLFSCYDLITTGDGSFLGGGCQGDAFVIEGGDRLVARPINIGSQAYAGLRSMLEGGVTIADRGRIAAYSYAKKDVASNQVAVGTEVYGQKPFRSVGMEAIAFVDREEEMVWFLVSLVSWFGASMLILGLGFFLQTLAMLPGLESALYGMLLLGAFLCLGIPCYAVVMTVLTKVLLVGSFKPQVARIEEQMNQGFMNRLGYLLKRAWSFGLNISVFRPFVMQAFAGTFFEVALQKVLGADIGQNVFLDNAFLFEPDLVSIGNNVSVGNSSVLSPHQYTHAGAMEFGMVYIGDRCTIGAACSVHGRVVMEDDTEMAPMSMPLIGTHMTSGGRWAGYPAAKKGEYARPSRLPLPIWYVLLQHPLSILFGSFWVVFLFLEGLVCFATNRANHDDKSRGSSAETASMTLPSCLDGLFVFDEGAFVRFDKGAWSSEIFYLRMDGSECVIHNGTGTKRGNWWDWATYHWTFSSDMLVAHGRVSLGWWMIPVDILKVKLHRDGDGWVWRHVWFRGSSAVDDLDKCRVMRLTCVVDNGSTWEDEEC